MALGHRTLVVVVLNRPAASVAGEPRKIDGMEVISATVILALGIGSVGVTEVHTVVMLAACGARQDDLTEVVLMPMPMVVGVCPECRVEVMAMVSQATAPRRASGVELILVEIPTASGGLLQDGLHHLAVLLEVIRPYQVDEAEMLSAVTSMDSEARKLNEMRVVSTKVLMALLLNGDRDVAVQCMAIFKRKNSGSTLASKILKAGWSQGIQGREPRPT